MIVKYSSTEPLDFQLKADDVAYNLTGCTLIELRLQYSDGTIISHKTTDASPKLAILDTATGKMRFTPDSDDLLDDNNTIKAFFWVTTSGGKKVSFPNEGCVTIKIEDGF